MSPELEVSVGKKDKVFLKRLQLFFFYFFVREKGNYISIQRRHFIRFKQLLVKVTC